MTRYVVAFGAHRIRLTQGVWQIGRDGRCDIVLDDASVSRRHATLRVGSESIELLDAGSRNGISVNGRRIATRAQIHPGDRITLGVLTLQIEDGDTGDAGAEKFGNSETRPLRRTPVAQVSPLEKLSPRERDVFGRIARGQTQRSIAEALGVSVKTIETHRARIGDKLGIRGRAELVSMAIAAGVLRED